MASLSLLTMAAGVALGAKTPNQEPVAMSTPCSRNVATSGKLRERILVEIAEKHPWLKPECDRQIQRDGLEDDPGRELTRWCRWSKAQASNLV